MSAYLPRGKPDHEVLPVETTRTLEDGRVVRFKVCGPCFAKGETNQVSPLKNGTWMHNNLGRRATGRGFKRDT